MDKKKVEKILIILSILITTIIVIIVYLVKQGAKLPSIDKEDKNNIIENSITGENTTIQQNDNILLYEEWVMPPGETEYDSWKADGKISQEEIKLEQDNSIYTYFLMKQCLERYYKAENYGTVMDLLDIETKENLNITYDNIANFYDDYIGVDFCIDKIYKQRTNPEDSSQNLYVVYHRIGKGTSKRDTVVFVKSEERTVSFSIYPYEYLQRKNYLSLKENDFVNVNNNEISQNDNNGYRVNDFSTSAWGQTVELYDRYKFDIQYDINGLYDKINEEYRNIRFENYENFVQYVYDTKQKVLQQELEKYLITEIGENKEFIALCGEDNYFVFYGKSLMEYTICLDNYTVLPLKQEDSYKPALSTTKSRFCIKRIIKAINDKNYKFIYQKLNPVQKNNYYSNYNDFKNYIIGEFYDSNDYEIEKKHIMVSSNVYQYKVKIINKENTQDWKEMTMTIALEEDADFDISITK